MQERDLKRAKTSGFKNEEEAEDYVVSLLQGSPWLPEEIWIRILSSNRTLSVNDITLMCRVNKFFKEICDSGIIWDEIFRRQFGEIWFKEIKMIWKKWNIKSDKLFKNLPNHMSLLRLIGFRIYNQPTRPGQGQLEWKFELPPISVHKNLSTVIRIIYTRKKWKILMPVLLTNENEEVKQMISYAFNVLDASALLGPQSGFTVKYVHRGAPRWISYNSVDTFAVPLIITMALLFDDGWIYQRYSDTGNKKDTAILTGDHLVL